MSFYEPLPLILSSISMTTIETMKKRNYNFINLFASLLKQFQLFRSLRDWIVWYRLFLFGQNAIESIETFEELFWIASHLCANESVAVCPWSFALPAWKGCSCPRRISPDIQHKNSTWIASSCTTTFMSRCTSIENFHCNFARSNGALAFFPLSLAVDINIRSGIHWFVLIELHNDSFSWNWLQWIHSVVPADRMGAKPQLLHAKANGQSAFCVHAIETKRMKKLFAEMFMVLYFEMRQQQQPKKKFAVADRCDGWWTLRRGHSCWTHGERRTATECREPVELNKNTYLRRSQLRVARPFRHMPVTVSVIIALANGPYTHMRHIKVASEKFGASQFYIFILFSFFSRFVYDLFENNSERNTKMKPRSLDAIFYTHRSKYE